MKRTSFLWQRQDRKFFRDDGKERSHQLKLKDVFECNDYFANSARMAAAAMIKSGQELAKLYIEDAKEDIKTIRKALRKKEKLSNNVAKYDDSEKGKRKLWEKTEIHIIGSIETRERRKQKNM